LKILFIVPGYGRKKDGSYIESWTMEPLTIAVLAALTPGGIEKKFYDDRVEKIPLTEDADLVAITAETYTALRAYEISKAYRERGIPVVLGGYHPTLLPREAAKYADAIVCGEAEDIWGELLNDAAEGRLNDVYKSTGRPSLSGIRPDRSIFRGKRYLPLALVETSRGCVHGCSFCSISAFYRQSHNQRPAGEVAEEIASLDRRPVFLVDDNIVANPAFAEELFKALIPLKIRWFSQCSIYGTRDRALVRLMRKSGCQGVLIGFESLDQENLEAMNKGWNTSLHSYRKILALLRDEGILVYGTFIFGYEGDTPGTIENALQFAMDEKLFIAAFNQLQPFPGTPVYEEMDKEDRLLSPAWWLQQDYRFGDVVFTPESMAPAELSEGCLEARRKFFRLSSIMKRAIDFKSNCGSLFRVAMFFRFNSLLGRDVEGRRQLMRVVKS
jgi:radical SAM superfamily enzyme YgiQ (UPF0313 family)